MSGSKEFKLNNGSIFVTVEAPGGLYNPEQLKTIAAIADTDAVMVKASENQRLCLVIEADKFDKVKSTLMEVGLGLNHYQQGIQVASCLGSNDPDSSQDSLGLALGLGGFLQKYESNTNLTIGIVGHGQSTVPVHTFDISLVGESDGYRMSIGGKNKMFPEFATFAAQHIPEDKVESLIEKVIEIYNANKQDNESLHDVVDRMGISAFLEVLMPYSRDAGGHEASLVPDVDEVMGVDDSESDADVGLDIDDLPHIDDLEDETSSDGVGSLDLEADMAAVEQAEGLDNDATDLDLEATDLDLDTTDLDLEAAQPEVEPEDSLELEGLEPETIEEEKQDFNLKGVVDSLDEVESDDLDTPSVEDFAMAHEEVKAEMNEDDLIDDIESEEDLEAKITQSIDEESLISYDDRSETERMQNVQMVEQFANTEVLHEPELQNEDFSNDVMSELDVNLEEEDAFADDANPIGQRRKSSETEQSFMIQSVTQRGQHIYIEFSTGASVSIDLDELRNTSGKMELVLNHQKVALEEADGTVHLKAGGIEFSIPSYKAA